MVLLILDGVGGITWIHLPFTMETTGMSIWPNATKQMTWKTARKPLPKRPFSIIDIWFERVGIIISRRGLVFERRRRMGQQGCPTASAQFVFAVCFGVCQCRISILELYKIGG